MEVPSVLKADNAQSKWGGYGEYEEVVNWDVDVQRMASTKKAKWKLTMDVIFGHTQIRSVLRKQEMQGNVFHKICHVCGRWGYLERCRRKG
eukprot:15331139-Ditylum_brightwellii.AAC.1